MSSMQTMSVGDVGTEIRLTVTDQDDTVVSLAAATVLEIHAQKPSGSTVEWTATLYGSGADGKIKYVTKTGDIDERGTWKIQAYVEVGAFKGHSRSVRFNVLPRITA